MTNEAHRRIGVHFFAVPSLCPGGKQLRRGLGAIRLLRTCCPLTWAGAWSVSSCSATLGRCPGFAGSSGLCGWSSMLFVDHTALRQRPPRAPTASTSPGGSMTVKSIPITATIQASSAYDSPPRCSRQWSASTVSSAPMPGQMILATASAGWCRVTVARIAQGPAESCRER